MNLTTNQIDFLVDTFFKSNYSGARNVAIKLVTLGKCTVAGTECIWRGGIGNFIETKSAEDFIGCMEYSFDLQRFVKSEMFKQGWKSSLSFYTAQARLLNEKLDDLQFFINISNS